MPEKPHIPFVPPTFSWDSPNLFSQFKLFKQKVVFAFKGMYKDNDAASKVCAILNWLGDNAYEIYEHLHWAAADDKDDLKNILNWNRTSSTVGFDLEVYTVASLSANMIS